MSIFEDFNIELYTIRWYHWLFLWAFRTYRSGHSGTNKLPPHYFYYKRAFGKWWIVKEGES